ncbi:MAG TPA: helix-turn-helix transcriptional regulator [Thermosynechococcaceae cyanobacterium]
MIHKSFDSTLKHYGITGKRLAEVTGLSQGHISEFRRGQTNPPCDTLERLINGLEAVEPGARRYFCQLMAGSAISPEVSLDHLSSTEMAGLLLAVADRLRRADSLQLSA